MYFGTHPAGRVIALGPTVTAFGVSVFSPLVFRNRESVVFIFPRCTFFGPSVVDFLRELPMIDEFGLFDYSLGIHVCPVEEVDKELGSGTY